MFAEVSNEGFIWLLHTGEPRGWGRCSNPPVSLHRAIHSPSCGSGVSRTGWHRLIWTGVRLAYEPLPSGALTINDNRPARNSLRVTCSSSHKPSAGWRHSLDRSNRSYRTSRAQSHREPEFDVPCGRCRSLLEHADPLTPIGQCNWECFAAVCGFRADCIDEKGQRWRVRRPASRCGEVFIHT